MDHLTEYILSGTAILLILSILLSKLMSRFAIPALLVFLAIGMLAGSEGIGGLYFDNAWVAQFIGVVALAFIIFAGGFHTSWHSIKPILSKGIILSTLGVFITATLTGIFSYYVLNLPFMTCMLLGSIICSTDAAAVFSVLNSKNVNLKGYLSPLLEFESGSNDPMAVLLTIGCIQVILGADASKASFIIFFVKQLAFGTIAGYLMGRLTIIVMEKLKLEYEGLYPVFVIALVLITYGGTALIGGSGFLAVYIMGILMGKARFKHKKELMDFHDAAAWLMQIIMFLMLGLLVFPSQLVPVIIPGLIISGFLMFVARPISVLLPLGFSKMKFRELILTSWVGLRGSVPIVLATFPLMSKVLHAEKIFNLIFFIVLTSVIIQGTSIPIVAKWLKLDEPTLK